MIIVEVGIKLEEPLEVYDKILKEHGAQNVYNCETHDIYYTNNNLHGLTENQMKNACIRLRNPREDSDEEKELINKGYHKVFDTTKKDHHYVIGNMKSVIQLQEIEDIGLVVYYDNPDYYEYDEEKQWDCLISELNTYGFNFDKNIRGIDKLRTLYYGKEMFSKNQNG